MEENKKPKGKHGGARPGSGAPKGNLNALKHGGRSRQFAEIGALIADSPEHLKVLLDLAKRHRTRKTKASEVAAEIIFLTYKHAGEIAAGKVSPGPFANLADKPKAAQEPDTRLNARPRRSNVAQSRKASATGASPNTNGAPPAKSTRPSTKKQPQPRKNNQPSDTKTPRKNVG